MGLAWDGRIMALTISASVLKMEAMMDEMLSEEYTDESSVQGCCDLKHEGDVARYLYFSHLFK
jgi:hypothetical protein